MAKKILIGLGVVLLAFAAYVYSRPSTFRVERSGLIKAPPEKIFPFLSSLKSGGEWSPYERIDPNLKKAYSGPEVGVGSVMEFAGNHDIGEGRLEILKVVPNSSVEIKLELKKPMKAENTVQYQLTPEADGTRFSWSMSGTANFAGKLIGVFINCDKMVGDQFNQGITNLRSIVEGKK